MCRARADLPLAEYLNDTATGHAPANHGIKLGYAGGDNLLLRELIAIADTSLTGSIDGIQ